MTAPTCIEPDWPAPAGVLALSTTRLGGTSAAPFDSLNVGAHVGDEAVCVAANREQLLALLPPGSRIAWLEQVHGTAVAQVPAVSAPLPADASVSRTSGAACTVMTADCLPVLLCDDRGEVVAAAHAGWRGLVAGVLERTVEAMACPGERLMAWLGPAIGPDAFEVGAEVREQFLAASPDTQAVGACFRDSPGRPGHFLADLYSLARLRLQACGVSSLYGGDHCTFSDPERFFSYRRDGRTGRMASLILLR